MRKHRTLLLIASLFVVSVLILAACGGNESREEVVEAAALQQEAEHGRAEATHSDSEGHQEGEGDHMEGEAGHEEEDGHGHSPEEHMMGDHGVPEEAAAVENPVAATEESVNAGAALFAQSCAVCHGESGRGDGPGAVGLEPKPADLHAEHVQENTDGALFWIITHGRPNTPMPPWEEILTEEQRWNAVNFLRTFKE